MTEPTRLTSDHLATSSRSTGRWSSATCTSCPSRIRRARSCRGIDLTVGQGEVHAIMGPNGSGKTTLAYALMGHPAYSVTQGEVLWKGQDILKLTPDKRARLGLFLAFQYPTAIPGVSVASFLRTALNARSRDRSGRRRDRPLRHDPRRHQLGDFRRLMREKMALLKLDDDIRSRYVNDGFSGGEKKRLEMLQMAVLRAGDGDPRRDRLWPRHRRAAHRGGGRQRPARPRARRAAHHPLPAPAELHHAGFRARARPRRSSWSGRRDLALRLESEGYGPVLREAGYEEAAAELDSVAVPVPETSVRMTTHCARQRGGRRPVAGSGRHPGPTSRSSNVTSAGAAWPTWTRPRRRSSRAS